MVRIKRGKAARKKKKALFQQVKGFRWGRKNRLKLAKDALRHALARSFEGRKQKKRTMRALWQTQINAACRQEGISYSKFIYGLKKNKIELDRKVLSQLAQEQPEIFKKIAEKAKS
ncbi:MAG: 50S ribosomal protein L20 [Candidatus Nealsonbacteria bacterium]|nr:50S ribosomal protein L20 [Candidatus Nealsonbacteria bacterium]